MRSFESVESMMGRLVEMRMLGIETTQPKLEKMIRQRLEPSWSTPKPPTFNELLSRVEQWKRVDRACRPPPRDAATEPDPVVLSDNERMVLGAMQSTAGSYKPSGATAATVCDALGVRGFAACPGEEPGCWRITDAGRRAFDPRFDWKPRPVRRTFGDYCGELPRRVDPFEILRHAAAIRRSEAVGYEPFVLECCPGCQGYCAGCLFPKGGCVCCPRCEGDEFREFQGYPQCACHKEPIGLSSTRRCTDVAMWTGGVACTANGDSECDDNICSFGY